MGASCATGSKTTDPDKEPYRASEKQKKKKGKGKEGPEDEPLEKRTVEEPRGGRDAASEESRRKPHAQDQEEPDGRRKTSESSRLRTASDDEAHQKRSSRGSSAEGPSSRPQSAEKRTDRREGPDEAAHGTTAMAEEQPRPRKRPSKEDKHSVETKNSTEEKQPEAAPRTRREDDGRTRRHPVEKKTPEVTSSSPDETAGGRSEEETRERKRSSLGSEFIVPVKVEGKTRDVGRRDLGEGGPHERVQKVSDITPSKERPRSPERNLPKPDLVRDSVVETKPKPKRRSAETDRTTGPEKPKDDKPDQNGFFTVEPSASCGVKDQDRSGGKRQAEVPGKSEIKDTESKSKLIHPEEIKIKENVTRSSLPAEVSQQETVKIVQKEAASPRRKTAPEEFETPPSGSTPRTISDAVVTSHPTSSSSRSSGAEMDGKRKSGSRQIPSPTKVDGNMAIFDALKGLSAQKPGPDVVPKTAGKEDSATASSGAGTGLVASNLSQQTPTTPPPHSTSTTPAPSVVVTNSSQSSPAKDATGQPSATQQASTQSSAKDATGQPSTTPQATTQSSPSKPIPATRLTIAQSKAATTETSSVKRDDKVSANGIDSPTSANENDLKTKPDRSSRLPVKGSTTSPITSPSVSTSDSISPPPVSPTAPSLSPSSAKSSDSAQRKDSKYASDLNEIDETKSLFIDLSKENQFILNAHKFDPNTRGKLLQAVEKWLTGTEKERENASRVMVVSGRPGIGKTCIATEICKRFSSQLAGEHFFQFQPRRLDQNFAKTMVLSLAAKLTKVVPGYSEFLPTSTDLRQLLEEGELNNLFSALVVRPLQNLNTDRRYLIVIDALDECWQADRDHLLQLINGFDKKTPDYIHLFCTIRDDNQLTGQLDRVQLIELKGTSDAMTSDIKRFLRDPMSRLIDRISLDGALTQLSQHSQGTFLAAYLLKRKLESYPDGSKLTLRDVGLFPSGFADICKEYLQRFYDYLSKKYSDKEATAVYSGLVGILALAKDRLSPAFVKQVHADLDSEKDLEPLRGLLDVDETGAVGLHHRSISEYLLSEQTAGPLTVAPGNARQRMAEAVLGWLASILEVPASNSSASVPLELQNYAVKHALEHLTDVSKNQDNIAGLLCNLVFIEKKLRLPGVTIEDLLNDYDHCHYQVTGPTSRLVTLEAYMKKFPDLARQIETYAMFVRRKGDQISKYPSFLLQFAANYPTVPRIRQLAVKDLGDKPWLEDVTANAESPSVRQTVTGSICQSDISSDNKYVAVMTHEEQTVLLYLLNVATGEFTGDPIDISNITDRKGFCVRFMPDKNHLFVGSLSTFISLKTWKPITSTLDSQALQLKESSFAIECCDAAGSTLACGISTLPWNGRTLYLGIYDLKTKKAKVIEVHSFRFGGSSQFGIKALALSQDGGLVSTCIKHQKKVELKVIVWNIASSKQLYTVDLENDALNKCFFVGTQSLVVSGGFATPENLQLTYLWSFSDKKAKQLPNDNPDNTSVAHAQGTLLTLVHRYQGSSQFVVSRWRKEAGKQEIPDDRYTLYGLEGLRDLVATEKSLIFLSRKSIQIYQYADLNAEKTRTAAGSFTLYNSIVESTGFFPRSDDPVVVHRSSTAYGDRDSLSTAVSASRVSVKSDGTLLGSELFASEKLERSGRRDGEPRCFQGEQAASNICSCTSDGSVVVINTGCSVRILEITSGAQRSLPNVAEASKGTSVSDASCAVSSKEPLVGVSYSEKPESLYIFDLRSKAAEPIVELKFDAKTRLTDFAFIPNNGNIITYHRTPDQSLIVWNQRSGATVSKQVGVDVIYIRQSPSSDRLVMSLRTTTGDNAGSLVLRNSDNQFNISLGLPQRSSSTPDLGCGDVEFSGDGTVLLGLFVGPKVLRAWNIGNGEALKDLEYGFVGPTSELVGMLTNTHALISDGWMLHVVNVDSGEILTALHSDDRLCTKQSPSGLRISPKGGLVAGSTHSGAELRLFRSHGLEPVKRKSTLQLFRNK